MADVGSAVAQLPGAESDRLFAARSRAARATVIVSRQSEPLEHRRLAYVRTGGACSARRLQP